MGITYKKKNQYIEQKKNKYIKKTIWSWERGNVVTVESCDHEKSLKVMWVCV